MIQYSIIPCISLCRELLYSMASILIVLSGAVLAAGVPSGLRTEYAVDPISIDNVAPRFSWELNSAVQVAYQVVVTSRDASVVWNSGIVSSRVSAGVPYGGATLLSDTDYSWAVSIMDSNGTWLNSTAATFSTALLHQQSDWEGVWIGGSNQLAVNFSLSNAQIVRARAYVTAVGCYELWVNGQRISRGGKNMSLPESYINPGISTIYSSRLLYNVYDLAGILSAGATNQIGLRLGSCKYGYLSEFCPNGNATTCNRAILQLNVVDGDKNRTSIVSGPHWSRSQGPVVYDHFYNGEVSLVFSSVKVTITAYSGDSPANCAGVRCSVGGAPVGCAGRSSSQNNVISNDAALRARHAPGDII
jgi:alpha-L-rhamnosidase